MKRDIFLPYLKDEEYLNSLTDNCILYTRFKDDFQSKCFLFKSSEEKSITESEMMDFKDKYNFCYVYDMFNMENKEFTVEGYKSINQDIKKAINMGFKYIMVSNPYIIELLCNEYKGDINVVISSQLEFNSLQSKIFLDVLNDTSCISHIILSQNHLNYTEVSSIIASMPDIKMVIELDRAASDNQIVHEFYYNILYGYYHENISEHLQKFLNENKTKFKTPKDMFYDCNNLNYKIGEINLKKEDIIYNLQKIKDKKIEEIKVIDFNLW